MRSDITDWIFDYDFSEKIAFLDEVVDSSTLRLKKSEKYITGFLLTIKNSSIEDAERKRDRKVKNLKCILTIKSGIPIELNLKSYHGIPKNGNTGHVTVTFTDSYSIEGGFRNLNLNDAHMESIINSSDSDSLKYEYATKAIFHYYNGNPTDCLKELFKVVGKNQQFPDCEKLKVLRDIFSHEPPYIKDTRTLFTNYFDNTSFDYKKYDPVNGWIIIDLESVKTLRHLNKIALVFIDAIRNRFRLYR